MLKKKMVLNSAVSVGSRQEFINEVITLAKYKVGSYICFANVHMVMEAYRDPAFQQIVNKANVVAPDGKPISLFINAFDKLKQERVCGMDLMPDLLKRADASGKSVYFYGSTNAVLSKIMQKALKEFPTLQICGSYSPPFRKLSETEEEEIISAIRKASPDLIFVSLGCPKQEKWMAQHKDKLQACLLGVGQAFNTYAGVEKRLPIWMRNLSLEWVYRLFLEPGRLWKRYLVTNSYFLWLTAGHAIAQLRNKLSPSFAEVPLSERQNVAEE